MGPAGLGQLQPGRLRGHRREGQGKVDQRYDPVHNGLYVTYSGESISP